MADFFFFTDTDLLLPQAVDKAYGPVNGFENSKYRLCSIHSSTSHSNAYAICAGTVFAQEDSSNPNLLNLVLRPLAQPDLKLPHIAYFIYRGIRKDSLIAAGGAEIAAAATNDLTNSIWDSQMKRNDSVDNTQGNPPGTTTDTPPAELLGINFTSSASTPYNLPDIDAINRVFFRTNVDYQLASVKGGWCIGKFDSVAFSLEIVFETLGVKVTAENVRNNDHVFELAALIGTESQPDKFSHWNSKEALLSYLDPAAFFGSFYENGLNAKASSDTNFTVYSGDQIYSNLLINYINRGRVYLDIRNEFNHSLNYFGNLGNDIMLSFDASSALSAIDYYRGNWPILIIDSDFPNGNTGAFNTLRFTLPLADMDFPRLYVHKAADEKSFPKSINGGDQLKNLQHTGSGFTSNEILMLTPNLVATDTTPIANYLRVSYIRSFSSLSSRISLGTRVQSQNAIDNLFSPIQMSMDWEQNTAATQTQIFNDTRFVDIRTFNKHSFLAKLGVSRDPDGRYVFFAFSVNTLESNQEYSVEPETRGEGVNSIPALTIVGDSIGATFISVATNVGGLPLTLEQVFNFYGADREGRAFIQNSNKLAYIKLEASEFSTILSVINNPSNGYLPDFPIWLGAKVIESGLDDTFENRYYCLEFYITGYYLNTGSNEIEIKKVSTGIKSYRLQAIQSLLSTI